ncbi:cell number regulator 10-like [Corylus avellana]|uniref:cell number regulator 10-like n=1 Tax=Corylus avellana TaxID=13451 RepID=UPI001E228F3D|nr:cell number regulator 10-like [Corylus avellana]
MNSKSPTLGQWSTGLYDCFEDYGNCCLTCCCPCVTVGRTAEIVSRGATSCCAAGATYVLLAYFGCQCLYTCTFRDKLRALFSLPEDPCADCCVHFWCAPCAICQEYRELVNRGLDPSLGWELNAKKMEAAVTSAPSVARGMAR